MFFILVQSIDQSCGSVPLKLSSAFDALVDLGSGLGHLPRRVMRRLSSEGPCRARIVAIEADRAMHVKSVETEALKAKAEERLVRVHARVQKERLGELREM